LQHIFLVSWTLLFLAALPCSARDGEESKDDRGYVKVLVEIKGQLSPIPKAKASDPLGGFVRVGDGFGMQVFRLDWSGAPDLREQAKKLPYKWVVLTGSVKPPGPDYVAIGYSGTVTVKTLKEVRGPDQK
jgi:hypothetical protein